MKKSKFFFYVMFFMLILFVVSGCGGSSHKFVNNEDVQRLDSDDVEPEVPVVESDDNSPSEPEIPDVPVIESNDNTPSTDSDDISGDDDEDTSTGDYLTSDDIDVQTTSSDTGDGTHVIEADGVTVSYSHLRINKTGDSDGEDADFYGENSAVFATNGATLTLTDSLIVTDGAHANAVFSYGEDTTVNVQDCVIITHDNNSGGIMTTGGGTMNATNLTITTEGGSSAAIRSDRGGGTVNVTGGSYTAAGRGSPAIYSTADITVTNAHLESTTAQGIVVEGKNSVTLNNCDLIANNVTHNSDKSSHYQAVMIYQSGSGDASEGKGEFTMTGGTLTNQNEDVFFINNTIADITLNDADIINNGDGVFMRAEAAGWGTSGSNGGKVNLYANDQLIKDNIVVDEVSILNMYLKDSSAFTGALNNENSGGQIYVELNSSTWTLTGDSYITSLTCAADSINLNGYSLYVNGTAYVSGSSSTGTAIEISSGNSGGGDSRPTPPGR